VVKRAAFAVPGDLATPTGGYAYDRRLIAELEKIGWAIEIVDLGDGFPSPDPATRSRAVEKLQALPVGLPTIIDGLAFGALPELAAGFCATHPVVALVHHPLALETGLSPEQADLLRASERTALSGARCVVAASPVVARMLIADYGVAAASVTVAPPGNDRVTYARGSGEDTLNLLSVGAIVPRKGYDVLVAALAAVSDLPWRLTIAGDDGRDSATAVQLRAQIAQAKLAQRIRMAGAVSDTALAALYAGADLFVLASRFEGYGMALAEAIAYGLPVIGTTSGALRETLPADAGLLVPPDDVVALAAALRRVIEDAALRQALAAEARRAARQLPTWEAAARDMARVIEAVT
jgi:glycosyltransferase involved in cell wall biosynthesis